MRRLLIGIAAIVVLAALLVPGHVALIEIGREVVTLRTVDPAGHRQETRLWIVDEGGASWLHSGGPDWLGRFDGNPVVEVERGGNTLRFRARPMPGPHPEVDRLLREKYGLADRWVRFIAPDDEDTIAVRLDPID